MPLYSSDLILYLGTVIDYNPNMKKTLVLLGLVLVGHLFGYGQLNKYKYIVVPTKFDVFKKENQFQTSTLIKYLLTNEGYNAVYNNALPIDLMGNPCLALRTNLVDNSSLFSTKVKLSLVDCNGVVIFETQEGSTRVKEYKQAYKEAISEAFGSLRGLNYTYEPKENEKASETVTISFENDIRSLEGDSNNNASGVAEKKESDPSKEQMVRPQIQELKEGSSGKDVLYAQPIEGGYQLVDATPKIVYVLKATSAPDIFLITKDGKNGVIFKDEGKWYVEMDEKGSKAKELNIKF